MARKRKRNTKLSVVLALVALALVYTFQGQQKPEAVTEQAVTPTESPASPSRQTKEARRKGIEIPAYLTDRDEEIVQHTGFTLSYNKARLLPNWVAWVLTAERTKGTLKRANNFQPDEGIKARPIAYDSDYRGSGYDRGHQCPSADCKYDRDAMNQCFLLSNICPQTHALNAGDWEELEKLCRKWAVAYDSIYIVSGPIIERGVEYDKIGSNGVTVPKQFYKVVLRWDGNRNAEAIGFIFDNDSSHKPLRQHAVTVDSVERRTGIDFFSKLPKDVERRAEATYDCDRWQNLP
ncbi:MAG: DNA/RNA non-specific endonuclease [Prevotellaceae bacterium]|nr:DNA/RNA non-specific endonuclease [Prevotellaceae bacterium]